MYIHAVQTCPTFLNSTSLYVPAKYSRPSLGYYDIIKVYVHVHEQITHMNHLLVAPLFAVASGQGLHAVYYKSQKQHDSMHATSLDQITMYMDVHVNE